MATMRYHQQQRFMCNSRTALADSYRLINHLASSLGLLNNAGNELLATEARVDGHEQDDVDLVHDVFAVIQRLVHDTVKM
jgi:hypothetical protein